MDSQAKDALFPPFPGFQPRAPWWSGDLQTLRNFLLRSHAEIPAVSERVAFPMDDGTGDVLLAMRDRPKRRADLPTVVLMHGLTGCEDSAYVRATARACVGAGAEVVRLSLRGAGPSRAVCGSSYHAGRTQDLRRVLERLDAGRLFLVGYSLGANMMLKFLAEHGPEFPIEGAVAVSAPIALAEACRRMMEARNGLYHRWILARMKEEAVGGAAKISPAERAAIENAASVLAFDNDFVAPRNGYVGAEAYYAANESRRYLRRIETPTLMIHASDDPWIPDDAYREAAGSLPCAVKLLLSSKGGHVGFHGLDRAMAWHDRCVLAMLSQPALSRRATSTAA